MEFIIKALGIIDQKNNEEIDIRKNEYHLFMKDAHVLIYFDEEEKEIKVNVEKYDEDRAKVFFSDVKLDEIM